MLGLLWAALSLAVASALPLKPRSVVVGFNALRSRDDSYLESFNIAKNLAPLILGDDVDHEFKELSTWDKGQAGLGSAEAWTRADIDLHSGHYCDGNDWSHRHRHAKHEGVDIEGCLDWCHGYSYCAFDPRNQSSTLYTCGRGNDCGWRRKSQETDALRVYKWERMPSIDIFIGIGFFLQEDAYRPLRMRSPLLHWTENDRLLGVPVTENTKSYKAQGRPFVITWDNEVFFSPDAQKYDVLLTTTRKCAEVCQDSLIIPFPFAMTSMLSRSRHTWSDLLKPGNEVSTTPKDKFCAFLQGGSLVGGRPGGCYKDCYRPDAAVRVAFFDILAEQYKRCTTFSEHCRQRPGDPSVPPTHDGETLYDSQVTLYEPYKFVISMENSGVEGYVTEKIISAALAGAVPIYFGAPDVAAWVNPQRFINCNIDVAELRNMNFPELHTAARGAKDEPFEKVIKWVKEKYAAELTTCVEQVRHLDIDDAAYEAVRSQPVVVEGSRLNFTAIGKMLGHVYRKVRSD